MLYVASAASDKLPNLSETLGSYLPPSNDYGSSKPKDSFQDVNFNIPLFSDNKQDGGIINTNLETNKNDDSDSKEGGRLDFSNFNFNIPKNAYVDPEFKSNHHESSEEADKVSSASHAVNKVPEQKPDDSFVISKHSSKIEQTPDAHGPICILANPYVQPGSKDQDKIPVAHSHESQGTFGYQTSREFIQHQNIFSPAKASEETRITYEERKKPIETKEEGFKQSKPNYVVPTLKKAQKAEYSPIKQDPSSFSSDESEERRRGHFLAGQPQLPTDGSLGVSKEESEDDLTFDVSLKSQITPRVSKSKPEDKYKTPSQAHPSSHHFKESSKISLRPIPARPITKLIQKDAEQSLETGFQDLDKSGEIKSSNLPQSIGSFHKNLDSVSRGHESSTHSSLSDVVKTHGFPTPSPSYRIPTPAIEKPTDAYKTSEPCCEVVEDGDSHPDKVYSLVAKSKPISIHDKSVQKDDSSEKHGTLSTSLFFKPSKEESKPKTHYQSSYDSRTHGEDKDSSEENLPHVKVTHEHSKTIKKIPHFTNKISQPTIELSKASQGLIRSKTPESPLQQTYKVPGQISSTGLQFGSPNIIKIPDSQDVQVSPKSHSSTNYYAGSSKSEQKPHKAKVETTFFSVPTHSISLKGSDEDTIKKSFKQPARGYPAIKDESREESKFSNKQILEHKSIQTIRKPSAPHIKSTFSHIQTGSPEKGASYGGASKTTFKSIPEKIHKTSIFSQQTPSIDTKPLVHSLPTFKATSKLDQSYESFKISPHIPKTSSSQHLKPKETSNFFKTPSLTFEKVQQTKKVFPKVTQDTTDYKSSQIDFTKSSTSDEDSKETHVFSKPSIGTPFKAQGRGSPVHQISKTGVSQKTSKPEGSYIDPNTGGLKTGGLPTVGSIFKTSTHESFNQAPKFKGSYRVPSPQGSYKVPSSENKHKASISSSLHKVPRIGGSQQTPSSGSIRDSFNIPGTSNIFQKDSHSEEDDTFKTSLFFKPDADSSQKEFPSVESFPQFDIFKTQKEDTHKFQQPVTKLSSVSKPKVDVSYKQPTRGRPTSRQPGRVTATKITKTSEESAEVKTTKTSKFPTTVKQFPSISVRKPISTDKHPSALGSIDFETSDESREEPSVPKTPQSKSSVLQSDNKFKKITSVPSRAQTSPKATGSTHFSSKETNVHKPQEPITKDKTHTSGKPIIGTFDTRGPEKTPTGTRRGSQSFSLPQSTFAQAKPHKQDTGARRGSQSFASPVTVSSAPKEGAGSQSSETTTMVSIIRNFKNSLFKIRLGILMFCLVHSS